MLDVRLDGTGTNAFPGGAGVLSMMLPVGAIDLGTLLLPVGVLEAPLIPLPPTPPTPLPTARLAAESMHIRFFRLLFPIRTRQQTSDSTAIIMRKIHRTVCFTHMEGSYIVR